MYPPLSNIHFIMSFMRRIISFFFNFSHTLVLNIKKIAEQRSHKVTATIIVYIKLELCFFSNLQLKGFKCHLEELRGHKVKEINLNNVCMVEGTGNTWETRIPDEILQNRMQLLHDTRLGEEQGISGRLLRIIINQLINLRINILNDHQASRALRANLWF